MLSPRRLTSLLFAGTLVLATGCATEETTETTVAEDTTSTEETVRTAVARLNPTEGNDVNGVVTFAEAGNGILIDAQVNGLEPGEHGFHIHENGDCSAPDGSSAGGHFAPQGSPHGAPSNAPDQRHAGDLGNIEADSAGVANYSRSDTLIAFQGPTNIIGKAVIVHAGTDDLSSQPSGDAGPRLACGVIEWQNEGAAMDTTSSM